MQKAGNGVSWAIYKSFGTEAEAKEYLGIDAEAAASRQTGCDSAANMADSGASGDVERRSPTQSKFM